MSIGEFSTASRLSQKALRLYGDKGLLAPAWVDPDSGYRHYRPEQLQAATLIALLRRAGVPLTEIRAFLRAPSVAWLDEYEQRTLDEFAERRRVLRLGRAGHPHDRGTARHGQDQADCGNRRPVAEAQSAA